MRLRATVGPETFSFSGVRDLLAKASPARSGDELSGVAAGNETERAAAQVCLADVELRSFLADPVVPYDEDEVTRLIVDSHDSGAFAPIAGLTVGEFRDYLLADDTDAETLAALAPGITPEMAAAVCKIMGNQDLIAVASKCSVVTAFRDTLGLPRRLSSRIQPMTHSGSWCPSSTVFATAAATLA